jgi:hypothetical protein
MRRDLEAKANHIRDVLASCDERRSIPYIRVEDLLVSRREFSLLLLLLLSALAVACERRPPPEDLRPEITVENIREDINGQRVRLPAEVGASEPSNWRFFLNEPKEIEILEKQLAGDKATFVINLQTRTSPRAEQKGITKKLAGRLRLHYELKSYFVVRKWEIVRIENISFKHQ